MATRPGPGVAASSADANPSSEPRGVRWTPASRSTSTTTFSKPWLNGGTTSAMPVGHDACDVAIVVTGIVRDNGSGNAPSRRRSSRSPCGWSEARTRNGRPATRLPSSRLSRSRSASSSAPRVADAAVTSTVGSRPGSSSDAAVTLRTPALAWRHRSHGDRVREGSRSACTW